MKNIFYEHDEYFTSQRTSEKFSNKLRLYFEWLHVVTLLIEIYYYTSNYHREFTLKLFHENQNNHMWLLLKLV